MCKLKHVPLMLVVCVMTFLYSVGSTNAASPLTGIDHKESVFKAYQKFLTLKSYHMTLNVTSSLSIQGKTMNTAIQGECDVLVKPMVGKNTMEYDYRYGHKKNAATDAAVY